MLFILEVARLMKRAPQISVSESSMVTEARGAVCREIYDLKGDKDLTYAFAIDDDVAPYNTEPQKVIDMIEYAEEHSCSTFATYKTAGRVNLVFKKTDKILEGQLHKGYTQMTDEELKEVKQWESFDFAPIGFAYIRLPPYDYKWHYDSRSEDFYFCYDTKPDLRITKDVLIAHKKLNWVY
jgi:hypothetical protein